MSKQKGVPGPPGWVQLTDPEARTPIYLRADAITAVWLREEGRAGADLMCGGEVFSVEEQPANVMELANYVAMDLKWIERQAERRS